MSANTVVNGTQDVGDAGLVMWWRGHPIPIPPVNSFTNGTEVTRFVLRTTDVLLNALGGYSSSAMGASTLYYVYINPDGVVRASATAPAYSWYGVRVLGLNAAARNWLFIGYARTNASTQFVDDTTNRLVVNWFNRLRKSIMLDPGYANDDAITTYSHTSTTYATVNAGSGSTGGYIANGEDSVSFHLNYYMTPAGAQAMAMGIADNSTTQPEVQNYTEANGVPSAGALNMILTPVEGYRTVSILAAVSAGTGTIRADVTREGAAADPRVTVLYGTVVT
jgi:hypothetical protein